MKRLVLPISGGIDSTVLLHRAVREFDEVHCLTFDYKQRHSKEIDYAKIQVEFARKINRNVTHKILNVSFISELAPTSSLTNINIDTPNVRDIRGEAQPKSYVANRNMIFISICASYAEAVKSNIVWHGAAMVDSLAGYWDGSPEFINSINDLLNLNRESPVRVEAPLIDMSKADIIKEGIKYKVRFSDTWTCYDGSSLADPSSASSSLRLQGFLEAGYADPVIYSNQKKLIEIYNEKQVALIPYETYLFKKLLGSSGSGST